MPGDSLQIGPEKVSGSPYHPIPALGDIVGCLTVDRPLTWAEVAVLTKNPSELGAKRLLTATELHIAPIPA